MTEICQRIVSNGNDDIPVNNETMKGDSDPGVVKSFGILYSLDGVKKLALTATENQTLDLVRPA